MCYFAFDHMDSFTWPANNSISFEYGMGKLDTTAFYSTDHLIQQVLLLPQPYAASSRTISIVEPTAMFMGRNQTVTAHWFVYHVNSDETVTPQTQFTTTFQCWDHKFGPIDYHHLVNTAYIVFFE